MGADGLAKPEMCPKAIGCRFHPANKESAAWCDTDPATTNLIHNYHRNFIGRCTSMCYLKLLDHCAAAVGRSDAQAWCGKQPGCMWEGGSCEPDPYMGNLGAWGMEMRKAAATCGGLSTPAQCEGVGAAHSSRVAATKVKAYLDAPIGEGSGMNCPV